MICYDIIWYVLECALVSSAIVSYGMVWYDMVWCGGEECGGTCGIYCGGIYYMPYGPGPDYGPGLLT